MKHTSIIIPTCKAAKDINSLVDEIYSTVDMEYYELIKTCQPLSAACNRNIGLRLAQYNNIIMVDDDITGLFPGWADMLIETLYMEEGGIILVSARLLHPDGRMGIMMNIIPDMTREIQVVKSGFVPTACVAFYKEDILFDENYKGSGWEDNDFCMQLKQKYGASVVIDNRVRLIHTNEKKNQTFMDENFEHYKTKWGIK